MRENHIFTKSLVVMTLLFGTASASMESDFNGDTRPDMLVKNTDNNRVTAWLNTPSGTVSQFIKALPEGVQLIGTANVNGDTHTDIITLNTSNGRVNAWVNTNSGTTTQYLKTLPEGVHITGMADMDGDGNSDIIVENMNNGRINAWLNTDSGTITEYLKTLPSNVNIAGHGDFNGDDKPDLLVHNSTNGRVNAWLNMDSGITTQYIKTLDSGVEIIGTGDIDGNGWTDIVVKNTNNGRVNAWLNSENGATTHFINSGTESIETVAIADIDADGNDDIIIKNTSNGRLNAWLNTDSGTQTHYIKTLSAEVQIVGLGDANGDDRTDIIVQNTQNGRVNGWLNTAQGTVVQHIKALGSDQVVVSPFIEMETPVSIEEQITERHNFYRNLEFSDSNLTWDNDLAAEAQAWADYLATNYTKAHHDAGTSPHASVFQADQHDHDDHTDGENIAWGTQLVYLTASPVDISTPNTATNGAVDLWANEKAYYDYATNATTVPGEAVGHYTQIAWQKTRKVGCGKATVQDENLGGEQVVCRYASAGNYVGQKPYCTEYSLAPYYTDNTLMFTPEMLENNSFNNTKIIEDRLNCLVNEVNTETLSFGLSGNGTFHSFDFFNNGGYVVNFVFTSTIDNGVLMMEGDVNGFNSVMSLKLIGEDAMYYYAEATWSLDSTNDGYRRSSIFKLLKSS
ncbi:MAG: SCP-like extracellular [uncultured Sulfurovum sp.]|uniref:SCP-like extracellular n=1 Tax=uncultured Sulfurovum sp. TaxID=269237 RepID=A0A6S6TIV3_9BACT|nr:MAG: SCP-like extracellular [uncultured Sulfurovum sp.]